MGTWASGPFDNDVAADWSGELDDASAPARVELIRVTLAQAADETGYLDAGVATSAVAAAAVVASQRPGGTGLVQTAYAPDFLEAGETLALPDDLAGLARRALHRILGDESELRELWEEVSKAAEWKEHLTGLDKLLAS